MENDRLFILIVLSSVFIGMLTISNVLAFKLVEFTTLLIAPAGVFAYAITYPMTDTMVEIFGKDRVKFIVLIGVLTQLLVLGVIQLSVILPSASFFQYQSEFALVLSQSSRIIFASLVAYLFSQLWDITIFSWTKKKTKGKYLWLRNNLSTISSQLLDSALFVIIAFYGMMSISELVMLVIGQYLVKVIIALIDTPIVYMLVYIIRNKFDIGELEI